MRGAATAVTASKRPLARAVTSLACVTVSPVETMVQPYHPYVESEVQGALGALRRRDAGSVRHARRLFEPGLDGASRPLAPRDDEHGVVSRHGPDDLGPPGGIEREPECLGAPRRCLQHKRSEERRVGKECC